MITTCTKCGGLYEAGSEEQAYEPERFCFTCRNDPLTRRRNTPPNGGGSFSPRPQPPAPTRCPSCGVKEATARCRWCGCYKHGAQAVEAAFRNILAHRFDRVDP